MPPRSSKRQGSSTCPAADNSLQRTNTLAGNTTGRAVDLPPELLHEITSHLPSKKPQFDVLPEENALDTVYFVKDDDAFARHDTLRALSQVSRAFRSCFLPMVWESVDLAAVRDGSGTWYSVTSRAMIRYGGGLAGSPDIAGLVRNLRVTVFQVSIDEALAGLVSILGACTNLRLVNVLFAHASSNAAFQKAFDGQSFPHIETLILSKQSQGLVKACPKAKTICCRGGENKLVTALGVPRHELEVLKGLKLTRTGWEKLVKLAPNLREIRSISDDIPDPSDIKLLYIMEKVFKSLKHLRKLDTRINADEDKVDQVMQERLPWMKTVLSDCMVTVRSTASDISWRWKVWEKTYYIPPRDLLEPLYKSRQFVELYTSSDKSLTAAAF